MMGGAVSAGAGARAKTGRRRFGWAVVVSMQLLLTSSGCESLIRGFIDIPESDVFARPASDAGFSFDGDVRVRTDELSLFNIRPNHGGFVGGTRVVIGGSGFDRGMEVRIGGRQVAATEISLLSPVAAEIVTPAGEVGPADVEVLLGGARRVLREAYTYDPVLILPSRGPTTGGTLVTVQSKGIDFDDQTSVLLAGQPLTDLTLISRSILRGRTPAVSQPGPVELQVKRDADDIKVGDAFTYYRSADPLAGGLGGGSINGTVTVSVLNWLTRAPIPGATVVLQKGRELLLKKQADQQGIAVFAADELTGEVTVTASAKDHETATIVEFDARDVTLFLTPIIPPQPGGFPPGVLVPLVEGNVLFGGSTGAGTVEWRIVPPPREDQIKRVYVFHSNQSLTRGGPPQPRPSATIDFVAGSGQTAWPYSLFTRLGTMALYAVAGLYNQRTGDFAPYAMGIVRGVVTAPGDQLRVDIVVNIPLTERLTLEVKDPPLGLDKHRVRLAINLGADGYIMRDDQQVEAEGVPSRLIFGRLPRFNHQGLIDGSYSVDVLFDSVSPTGLPLARGTEPLIAAVGDDGSPISTIVIDEFVGAPRQVTPAPRGELQGNTLRWTRGDGASPDIAVTVLQKTDETPVWRVISPGDVTEVKLPDPRTLGLTEWPKEPLVWLQWLARIDNYDFNRFNYDDTSSSVWRRWSFDEFSLKVTR